MVTGILSHELMDRAHCGGFILLSDTLNTKHASHNVHIPPTPSYSVNWMDVPINTQCKKIYYNCHMIQIKMGRYERECLSTTKNFHAATITTNKKSCVIMVLSFKHISFFGCTPVTIILTWKLLGGIIIQGKKRIKIIIKY